MTAEIIPFIEQPKPKIESFCSFCKRKEGEVQRLFTNSLPRNEGYAGICADCVQWAKQRAESVGAQ